MKLNLLVTPLKIGQSLVSPMIRQDLRDGLSGQRFTKSDVLYVPVSPFPPIAWVYDCATCNFYLDHSCQIVKGTISPYGWCAVWVSRSTDEPFAWASPSAIQDRLISNELTFRKNQTGYFMSLEKDPGSIFSNTMQQIVPEVFMPVIETPQSGLAVVFIEPGAAHLVFHDEVAPDPGVDEKYRTIRKQVFGRRTDVESIQFHSDHEVRFYNNASLIQLYETSIHYASVEPYAGKIYVNTWNHLMSARPSPAIMLHGGYRSVPVQTMAGTRDEADEWEDPNAG